MCQQHQLSLFQSWKQYTQLTIVNLAALLLEERPASFHGILQSWGDPLLSCELWAPLCFPADTGTVRAHYFSHTMCSGSVKPLWWINFLSQTLLGETAKKRGVEKRVVPSTMIWAQHHHLLQHPAFFIIFCHRYLQHFHSGAVAWRIPHHIKL